MPTTLTALAAVLDDAVLVRHSDDPMLRDAVHDSRAAGPGTLFCAVPGAHTDGHDHAAAAVAGGCAAVLAERQLEIDVPQLVVPSTREALGPAAAAVHGDPSRACTVIGVTGTNGKTTTVALVEAAVAAAGRGVGVVGTTGARVHGASVPNDRTTPEATDLQRLLRTFVDRGAAVAAIEVSSHGLALGRIAGTHLAVAGFTMLGEDHLDFHGDRAAYLAAKQSLFTPAFTDRAVVVVDDDAGRTVAADAATAGLDVVTLSTGGGAADLELDVVDTTVAGGTGSVRPATARGRALLPTSRPVSTRMIGRHNLANAALAWALAVVAGIDADDAAAGIAACPPTSGRLERVGDDDRVVLVDYAHTPDAVRTVVAALRTLLPAGARLAVVLGAGGDRDRGKRGPMGAAAAAADLAVLTSDNPRSEDPAAIVAALEAGARAAVEAGAPATVRVQLDRRAAIAEAIVWARPGDAVLVAGKGHETGQVFADRTEPFDDRAVAHALLRGAA